MYEDFVAERIRQLRKQKKISAREMSLSIGQNVNYINRIEQKCNLPSLQGLFSICEYFEISPQEFFESTSKASPLIIKTAIQVLEDLKDEEISLIISVAKAIGKNNQ